MVQPDAALDDDPFLAAWTRTRRPPLAPQHLLTARLQHAAAVQELDDLDAELETLAARRRGLISRLERLRPRLWPNRSGHHRRRPSIGIPPLPPPPPGARPLAGHELRATAVAVLHRHGACPLRELHGLLHRYGYVIDGERIVQRLSDALAYEVEQGRCERVRRGVYRAVRQVSAGPAVDLPGELLAWDDPDPEGPRPDAFVADDPERWSAARWPTSGLDPDGPGDDMSAGGGGDDGPEDVWPEDDGPDGEDLDEAVRLAHRRAAEFVRSNIESRDQIPPGLGGPHLFEERWRRFAVESVPGVRHWLAKGARWGRWGVHDEGEEPPRA